MSRKRRSFKRPTGRRRYRKLFILAVEGAKTEPEYFRWFNHPEFQIKIECLRDKHHNSPTHVLNRMQKHLQRIEFRDDDEAWLVVDKDQWTDEQLSALHDWSQRQANYGFALSNPLFEYWLLLHYEDGIGVNSSNECIQRLREYLPDYDKSIDTTKITQKMVETAMERAKRRDSPPCRDWPKNPGCTTVYKLVEKITESWGD